jgi:Leucine-rich repeat (LRR) protein
VRTNTSHPQELGLLTKLQELYLMENKLMKLPGTIGRLSNLKELLIDFNNIKKLPPQIGMMMHQCVTRWNNPSLLS